MVAGLVGTVAMTSVMKGRASRWFAPDRLPREFVPKQIVERVEEAVAPGALTEAEEMRLTMPAHYGYGGTMGAVYGPVRHRLAGLPAPVVGALFGLGVWALGYVGWLPAIGVREGTAAGSRRRMVAPLVAHLVYGAATALVYEALDR